MSARRKSFQAETAADEKPISQAQPVRKTSFVMNGFRKMSEISGHVIKRVSDAFSEDENDEPTVGVNPDYESETDSWASPRGDENISGPFGVPANWPMSAELAMKMLDEERSNLKKSDSVVEKLRQNMLVTNRFLAGNIRKILGEKKDAFRDGIDPIAHILPPDAQRELHHRVCMAAKNGEKDILVSLLRFSVDLDRSDMFGTPLHYAAAFGRLEAIQLLLEKGSYPGALNPQNQTPLHLSTKRNSPVCSELLLQFGAPVNAADFSDRCAVHIAAAHGFTQVLDVLILAGADCNRRTGLGLTPLHLAVLGRHPAVIEALCRDGGADPAVGCSRTVEIGDSDEDTAERPHVRAVQGDTPAHFAARKVPARIRSAADASRIPA